MSSYIKAKAVVTVTLDVEVDGRWGEGCKIEQVHKQARDAMFHILDAHNRRAHQKFTLRKDSVKVKMILFEEE